MTTDDEIIKALKCCASKRILCSRCPNKKVGKDCSDLTKTNALALIRRQKAEIEKLEEDVKAQDDSIKSLLSIVNSNYQNGRIDATKEFVERLKAKSKKRVSDNHGARIYIEDIDNLLKEMEKGK